MRNLNKMFLKLLCGTMLISGSFPLAAGEEQLVQAREIKEDSEKHLPAGPRALSIAEFAQIQEKRAAEPASGMEFEPGQASKPALPAAAAAAISKMTSASTVLTPESTKGAIYYVTTHEGALHNAIIVGAIGERVELEDGSIWNVRGSDHFKALSWFSTDLIFVAPNHELFSSYAFKMHNVNTGDALAVNLSLFLNPIFHSVFNHIVVDVSPILQMVWLEDGSVWSITGWDDLSRWAIGDTVIVGINDGWLSSSNPNILINCDLLYYVRGNCLN